MADITISGLPQGTPPSNSLIPFSGGGLTKSSTLNNLFKEASGMLLGGNLVFTQDVTEYLIRTPTNGGAIRLRGNSVTAVDRQLELGHIDNNLNWSSVMLIAEGGYVGINTRTPSTALEVNGTVKASGLQVPGSILQIQYYTYETSSGFTNTATWDQFFSLSFTPKYSTSKLLIQSNFMCSGNGGIRMRRGNTELFHPWSTRPEYASGQSDADRPYWVWDWYSALNQSTWNNGSTRRPASFNVMDATHNTTNAISYNFDVKVYDGNKGFGFNEHNRKDNGNPGAPSTVIIWEIGA